MKNMRRLALLAVGGLLAGSSLACSEAKPYSSQCTFIIGDGAGEKHELKKILYPNQKIDKGDDRAWYIPCNTRNFIINPAGQKNANGDEIGDRHDPMLAKTKRGETAAQPAVPIKVWASTTWTLNKTKKAMTAFLPVCEKYRCYTDSADQAGNANFSTPGWNGMLGETMSQAANAAMVRAAAEFGPDLHDNQALWPKLSAVFSKYFFEEARNFTGSPEDFFCAPGLQKVNDNGTDAEGPCEPPKWTITGVESNDPRITQSLNDAVIANSASQLNDTRLREAKKLYGEYAYYFLGLQDTIEKCKEAGSTCIINLGGGNTPTVAVPKP